MWTRLLCVVLVGAGILCAYLLGPHVPTRLLVTAFAAIALGLLVAAANRSARS